MSPSLDDIATFLGLLVVAGTVPVVLLPGMSISSLLGTAQTAVGALPLEHVGFAVLLGILAAAWFSTTESPPARTETSIERAD